MFYDTSFWVAVAFFLFIAMVFKPAKKAIISGLDGKAEKIRSDLEHARKLHDEAQDTLANFQRKQQEVLKEAEELLMNAKAESEAIANESQIRIKEQLEARLEVAMQKIALAEQNAVESVQKNALDIAMSAASIYLQKHLPNQAADELIAEATKDFAKKLH
jgi:F-type H+-transporting ATPase subunit b